MIKKYTNNFITWIDVDDPTTDELRTLMDEYDINPDIARELQLPTYKEKIVMEKDYLYLVLHFPAIRHTHKDESEEQEIDFIVKTPEGVTAYEVKTFATKSDLNKLKRICQKLKISNFYIVSRKYVDLPGCIYLFQL